MQYYSHLEDYINQLYTYLSIYTPEQLNVADIAQKLGVKLLYSDFSLQYDNYIVLKRTSKQREWQEFGHEIGHYLFHAGNQFKMFYMLRDMQEWKADLFAYHFCIPTFMLEKLINTDVYEIMYLFNVEYHFALRRMEMYQNKLLLV